MIRFGTDGIRGRAGESPITEAVAAAVGRAAARWARGAGGEAVIVGRDTRPSGAALEGAVAAGVAAEGLIARVGGVLPTPGVAAAVAAEAGATGVVITASHNPEADNGFKVLGPGGRKPTDSETAQIEGWIAAPEPSRGGGRVEVCPDRLAARYTAALGAALGDLSALTGRRVAIDLARGAGVATAPWLRAALPCDLVVIGDDRGAINDGCGALHPDELARVVRAEGCFGGVAIDGDGDRCVLLDALGRIVDGDALAVWLTRALHAPVLAVTVMSNAAVESALPGVRVVRTPVGDRHLQAAIAEHGATLGVEASGHALFVDGLPAGDGLLTGLRALALAAARGLSIADAVADFRPFPSRLLKVPVSDRRALEDTPIAAAARAGEVRLGPGGRVFIRYSGTEPLLRILVEGRDADEVARVGDAVRDAALEVWR